MLNFLLDIIFPIKCFGCNQNGAYLCPNCYKTKLDFNPIQKCPVCNKSSPNGQTHTRCFSPYSIDGVFAITHKNILLTSILKQLKYRHSHHIISAFEPIIAKTPSQFHDFDLIIPIPLHPKRLNQRGFNQAELLSIIFSRILNVPANPNLLVRARYTTPQADIHDRPTRLHNLKNVFQLTKSLDKQIIYNKKVLLIDDVSTTGATLCHAATPLKRNGASAVWGLVITR